MTFLLDCALKISAILTMSLVAVFVARRRSAALRHWILTATIVLCAVTPAIVLLMPQWHLPQPVIETVPVAVADSPVMTLDTARMDPSANPVMPAFGIAGNLPLLIWILGATVCGLVLVAGWFRLRHVASAARPLESGRWSQITASIANEYRIGRPLRLLQSPNPSILATWGIFRPTLILPDGAATWSEHRVHAVLSHELAHIRRRDWLVQILAEMLRVIYWFNPLLWIVCSRLRLESEYACDDAALRRGISGPDYATQLLDLARDLNVSNRAWSSALAMARPSTVERRFKAMLNPSVNRRPVTRKTILATVLIIAALTLPIVTFSSTIEEQASARLGGTVSDVSGAPVRGATVIVSTPDGRTEVTMTTNATGRFAFANLPAGMHVIQVFATGFGPSRITNVELKPGQQTTHNVTMDIGFAANQETRTPATRPVIVTPPPAPQASTKYTGELISIDCKNCSLKDFFRFIADTTRFNIVMDPDVDGSMTMTLRDAPWDEVVDRVLRQYSLDMTLQGNVYRIGRRFLPQQIGNGVIQGSVVDASAAVIPGVSISVTGSTLGNLARTTFTDESGSFDVDALPAGNYRVTISLPGFKTLNYDNTNVPDGGATRVDARMAVAPVHEMVTVVSTAGPAGNAPPQYGDAPPVCSNPPPPPPGEPQPTFRMVEGRMRVRQGGNVQIAMMTGQTKPIYPAEARSASIQGTVVMAVVIGKDGRVIENKVLSGHPILAASATQAVNRWCYRPTKLNGVPVETVADVTVNFVLQ